jgi:hypothetical protein
MYVLSVSALLCVFISVVCQVVEHIQDIIRAGMERARWQGRDSMDDLCIMMTVRNDAKRVAKLQFLMETNQKIKVFFFFS